jgi:membrane complex biogenesis BtpA family protein
VRVNVSSGAAVADQGILEGEAHEIARARARLAPAVKILADVHVKHATPLGPRPIGDEALDAVRRGLADAVVVSGGRTGSRPSTADLRAAAKALGGVAPVFVGSGLDATNAPALFAVADGALVGTSVKVGGVTEAAVDPSRAARLVKAVTRSR